MVPTSTPLEDVKWLIIDTEYTVPSRHCVEVAAYVAGVGVPRIDAFLRPQVKEPTRLLRPYVRMMRTRYPEYYSEVGDDETLVERYVNGALFLSIIPILLHLATDHVIVAHNYRGAEYQLFKKEFKRYGLGEPEFSYICSYELGRRLFRQFNSQDIGYSQDSLGKLTGLPFSSKVYGVRHTALADTKHLLVLFNALLKKAIDSPFGVRTLGDLEWLQNEDVAIIHEMMEKNA